MCPLPFTGKRNYAFISFVIKNSPLFLGFLRFEAKFIYTDSKILGRVIFVYVREKT